MGGNHNIFISSPSNWPPNSRQTYHGKSYPCSMQESGQVGSLHEMPENVSWQVTYDNRKILVEVLGYQAQKFRNQSWELV